MKRDPSRDIEAIKDADFLRRAFGHELGNARLKMNLIHKVKEHFEKIPSEYRTPELEIYIRSITNGVHTLNELSNLLELSSLGEDEIMKYSTRFELIRDVLSPLLKTDSEELTDLGLTWKLYHEESCPVFFHEQLIYTCLHSIAGNAKKFSPPSSIVHQAVRIKDGELEIVVENKNAGRREGIAIGKDLGIGLPMTRHIFKKINGNVEIYPSKNFSDFQEYPLSKQFGLGVEKDESPDGYDIFGIKIKIPMSSITWYPPDLNLEKIEE